MEIAPFDNEHIPQAAALFVQSFEQLRLAVPEVPDRLEAAGPVSAYLERLLEISSGVIALQGGQLVGYLGWFYVEDFRGSSRKAAYCPEWGHAAAQDGKAAIYRALYRAAAEQWAAAECRVHALTLLAHDRDAEHAWFWNGFGLTVVDAIRSTQPLHVPAPAGFQLCKATPTEAAILSQLDEEHWQHYAAAPVFMFPQPPSSAAEFATLVESPPASAWLAWRAGDPAGFLRFEPSGFGAADSMQAEDSVAITGAYIRPEHRGRGLMAALLDAALRDYADHGFQRCSVDFESFNPEAASFWMKYFRPVCLSLTRAPENVPEGVSEKG